MNRALLEGFPVVVEQAVVWGDMDFYRHVNNVVYFRYFENARLEYFRRLDWFEYEKETGIGPILADTQASFRKALTYPDQIAIGVRVTDILTDRFTMEYRIVSEAQNAIATHGKGTIVAFHYAQGRKVALTEELLGRIAKLQAGA
jgi:acyl-CoA thioester hydrolase